MMNDDDTQKNDQSKTTGQRIKTYLCQCTFWYPQLSSIINPVGTPNFTGTFKLILIGQRVSRLSAKIAFVSKYCRYRQYVTKKCAWMQQALAVTLTSSVSF